MISGPKSRNDRNFALFREKSHFFAKNRTFPLFSLQNAKNAQRSQGLLKPMPFIGILSSFSRKGGNVRNFAFLRGIFGFLRTFSLFHSKMGKIAKVRFEQKVPLTKRIYIRSNLDRSFFHFWSDFSLFAILGDKSAPERKNQFLALFWSKNRKKAF